MILSNAFLEDGAFHEGGGVVGVPYLFGLVANDLRISISPTEVVFLGVFVHLGIIDRVDTTFLPIRMHTVEQQIDILEFVQSTEHMYPAKGEEASIALFVSRIKVGDAEAESHEIIVLIDHKISKFQIDEGEIFVDIYVDLLIGHRHEIVEVFESGIDGQEELFGVEVGVVVVVGVVGVAILVKSFINE